MYMRKGKFYSFICLLTWHFNLWYHVCRYFIIIEDIWEISYWNMIRCALPDESDEHRIITTTRIFTVAEQIGGPYKMNKLKYIPIILP